MNFRMRIPRSTQAKLAQPATTGARHRQIMEISCALIAAGNSDESIFAVLRPNYANDVPDFEIWTAIKWAKSKIPNRPLNGGGFELRITGQNHNPPISIPPIPAEEAIGRFLSGFSCEEADLIERSPVKLPHLFEEDAELLIQMLYSADERINIVSNFTRNGGKANPVGRGITLKRDEWLTRFSKNGPPSSDSGVWVRPNPVDGRGVADTNVKEFRFILLEFDGIPLSTQISFFAQLPLPIAAIISSGGKSVHAWVRVDLKSPLIYRGVSARIFSCLAPFGIDSANRNPGRLSRLPGVFRKIGGTGQGRQKLLYLNPSPDFRRIIE